MSSLELAFEVPRQIALSVPLPHMDTMFLSYFLVGLFVFSAKARLAHYDKDWLVIPISLSVFVLFWPYIVFWNEAKLVERREKLDEAHYLVERLEEQLGLEEKVSTPSS